MEVKKHGWCIFRQLKNLNKKNRPALSGQTHQLPLPSFPQLHFELCHPLSIQGTAHIARLLQYHIMTSKWQH